MQRDGGFSAAGAALDHGYPLDIIPHNFILLFLERLQDCFHMGISIAAQRLAQHFVVRRHADIGIAYERAVLKNIPSFVPQGSRYSSGRRRKGGRARFRFIIKGCDRRAPIGCKNCTRFRIPQRMNAQIVALRFRLCRVFLKDKSGKIRLLQLLSESGKELERINVRVRIKQLIVQEILLFVFLQFIKIIAEIFPFLQDILFCGASDASIPFRYTV